MKIRFITTTILLFLIISTNVSAKKYWIKNPFNQNLTDHSVTLSRAKVEKIMRKKIKENEVILIKNRQGEIIPSQCDDLDNDGNWDELFFLIDIKANEKARYNFTIIDSASAPTFTTRTSLRFSYRQEPYEPAHEALRLKSTESWKISQVFQMEGPALENDIVGFRNYYDARNGMDIFGKRTSEMVLHKAGIEGQNYHALSDWGMDVLKVNNSLGAGSIAIGFNDNIYRLGLSEKSGFKLITEGPLRTIIELWHEDIFAGDRKYNLTQRITIQAGEHFYRSKVTIDNLKGDELFYTGIVDLHNLPQIELENENIKISATHGNQGTINELLGLGLLIPDKYFNRYKTAPKEGGGITYTHLAELKFDKNNSVEHSFIVGWIYQDEKFEDLDYFKSILKESALKLNKLKMK